MQFPEFLVQDTDGEIFLAGHRIGIWHIVDFYYQGFSPEMLKGQFPTLSLALIHKTIAFYLENQQSMDEHVRREQAKALAARTRGKNLDIDKLRKRLTSNPSNEA